MSSTAPRNASSRLVSAAAAERTSLLRERERLAQRRDRMASELDGLERGLADLDERLGLIDRLAPEAANVLPLPSRAHEGLKGRAIARAAVEVLVSAERASQPVHYKEWFDLLTRAGHRVAGKDPLAVFLTQISRSPVVRRTTHAGIYELDLRAPQRLSVQLKRLLERLGQVSPTGTRKAREQRDELIAQINAVERALVESRRLLEHRIDGSEAHATA